MHDRSNDENLLRLNILNQVQKIRPHDAATRDDRLGDDKYLRALMARLQELVYDRRNAASAWNQIVIVPEHRCLGRVLLFERVTNASTQEVCIFSGGRNQAAFGPRDPVTQQFPQQTAKLEHLAQIARRMVHERQQVSEACSASSAEKAL